MAPLEQQREMELRQWLRKAQLATLKQVAEAQLKKHQADALTDAVKSQTGDMLLDRGNAKLIKAQRYATFLEVLEEFASHPEGTAFEIAKLK